MDLIVTPGGLARWGGWTMRCALGRGVVRAKREGDGCTPVGRWPMRRVMVRRDRLGAPATWLPVAPIGRNHLWCDDPGHARYNRPVRAPFPASTEALWRDDGVYDLIVVLGHNDAPPRRGHGSAVFLHVATPGYSATAGCVALARRDLLRVLRGARPGDAVTVLA